MAKKAGHSQEKRGQRMVLLQWLLASIFRGFFCFLVLCGPLWPNICFCCLLFVVVVVVCAVSIICMYGTGLLVYPEDPTLCAGAVDPRNPPPTYFLAAESNSKHLLECFRRVWVILGHRGRVKCGYELKSQMWLFYGIGLGFNQVF